MRSFFSLLLLALIANIGVAQQKSCQAGPAVTIEDRDGVTAKKIWLQGPSGKLSAHVFIPDRAEPVPGFAFSHSSIQYPDSQTDLLLFARTVARAGSAIIMLDGSIDWQTTHDDVKIPAENVACVAHWLMSNANLDLERLSVGGPMKFPSDADPFCPELGKQPCWQAWFYAYWEPSHEANYTKLMKTPEGQFWTMRNMPESFGLKDVKLEWLTGDPSPKAAAQR